jgi:hypothetical protein
VADQPQQLTAPGPADSGIADDGPINLHAIRTATLHRAPWCYAVIADTFVNDLAMADLVATYPTARFRQVTQNDEYKQFVVQARNDIQLRDLGDPCPWQRFLRQVTGPAYRAAMQDLTGLDLTEAILKVAFYRYPPDAWFSPHPDDERKLLSHIFYINAVWPDDAGGRLLIHARKDPDDVHASVVPLVGTSVAVVRSDNSWHSVQPVAAGCGLTRQSLIAHFYQPGSDVSFYDR